VGVIRSLRGGIAHPSQLEIVGIGVTVGCVHRDQVGYVEKASFQFCSQFVDLGRCALDPFGEIGHGVNRSLFVVAAKTCDLFPGLSLRRPKRFSFLSPDPNGLVQCHKSIEVEVQTTAP
jgi:hypothetical protein